MTEGKNTSKTVRSGTMIAALLATAATLGGCDKSPGDAKPGDAKNAAPKIGMSFQEMNNPYFVSMREALENAAKSVGAPLVITDARHDVNKQIADVQDMIQQGVKVLLVNPTDSVGIQSAVQAAHDKGVVVVAVDANASGPVDTFVGSKNRDAGYQSCKYIAR